MKKNVGIILISAVLSIITLLSCNNSQYINTSSYNTTPTTVKSDVNESSSTTEKSISITSNEKIETMPSDSYDLEFSDIIEDGEAAYSLSDIFIKEGDNGLYIPSKYKGLKVIKVNIKRTINNFDSKWIYIPKTIKSFSSGVMKFKEIYYEGSADDWCNISFSTHFDSDFTVYVLDSFGDIDFNGKKYSKLSELIISDAVSSIGNYQFYNFKQIKAIKISNKVMSIGDFSFENCTGLENVIIGDGVNNLGDGAFYSCINLKNIVIPGCINSINENTFKFCDSLTTLYYNGTLSDWCRIQFHGSNNLMKHVSDFFLLDESGKKDYDNKNYSLLTEIVIPETITNIGSYQFYNFKNVKNVVIPNCVTHIGEGAFNGCSSIENISIPFVGCESQKSNPKNNYTFGYIFGDIEYEGGYLIKQKYGNTFWGEQTRDYYIPASLKKVEITNDSKIPYGSFYNCDNISCIVMSNEVTNIDEYAFYNCSNLLKIVIPEKVGSIAYNSFLNCYRLVEVYNLSSLDRIKLPIGNEHMVVHDSINDESILISDENGYLFAFIENQWYLIGYNGNDTDLVLPSSFYYNSSLFNHYIMNKRAFENYDKITSIVIPSSVTSIESFAFRDCKMLQNVTIENGLTGISEGLFYGCEKLLNIMLPNTIESIEGQAFYGCKNLKNVVIPNSVERIAGGSFNGCSSLESITIPFTGEKRYSSNDEYQSPFGYIFGINNYDGGVPTKQYYFGETMDDLKEATYYIPSSLTEVLITDVDYLPFFTFRNCFNLKKVVISKNLDCNTNYAFAFDFSFRQINKNGFMYISVIEITDITKNELFSGINSFAINDTLNSISIKYKNSTNEKIFTISNPTNSTVNDIILFFENSNLKIGDVISFNITRNNEILDLEFEVKQFASFI